MLALQWDFGAGVYRRRSFLLHQIVYEAQVYREFDSEAWSWRVYRNGFALSSGTCGNKEDAMECADGSLRQLIGDLARELDRFVTTSHLSHEPPRIGRILGPEEAE